MSLSWIISLLKPTKVPTEWIHHLTLQTKRAAVSFLQLSKQSVKGKKANTEKTCLAYSWLIHILYAQPFLDKRHNTYIYEYTQAFIHDPQK